MDKEKVISFDSKTSVIKKRDSNLELFRIITMLLIVAHHFVVNSGLMANGGVIYSSPFSAKSIFLFLFGAWGKTGINCFIMITGYFMCKSNITLNKYLKLLFEVYFYKIVISSVFWITKYETFSLRSLCKVLLPFQAIERNFTWCFLLFYLLIPFINILIKNLSEKQHISLIIILFFTYTLLGTVKRVTFNYVTWFSVVYIISAYIRLYPKKIFNSNKIVWFMLASILLSVLSVIGCVYMLNKTNKEMVYYLVYYLVYYFVTDSNSFLPLITSITAFLFFKNLKINYNGLINAMGASTFGVLLIHANSDIMRDWLWIDFLKVTEYFSSDFMPLYAVICVITIFILCCIIDQLRIKFLEKPFFNRFFGKIQSLSDSVCNKFNNMADKINIK